MIDPISLAVGAGILALGWFAGRGARKPPRSPEPPEIICSCEHGYGAHHEGKKCASQVKRPHYLKVTGERSGHEWVPCACFSYDGPEPLPRVWTEPS